MVDETWKYLDIDITGIVQGVGFRPFVYRLAGDHGIKGSVTNTPEGVNIGAAGDEEDLRSFLEALPREAPPQAVIEEMRCNEAQPFDADSFEIITSSHEGERQTLISPDLATCDDCLAELFDSEDRRHLYPFINCTNCGPRFTIIRATPYDRPTTTMAEFEMCELCEREYHDPSDRRFHAQPNACPACGPRLWLTGENGEVLPGGAVKEAASLLKEGKIVALKGLGGFQLACDATSDQAVSRMRKRKNRYAKPLAVMVADMEQAEVFCRVSEEERELLMSTKRPIVLLEEKQGSGLSRQVAPGLRHQGIFLPYTPLHHLLMGEVGMPLVMTSGNLSEEPIAKDNQEALRRLKGIADYYLLHDRGILVRYDDSVTRILADEEYPIRRARGYAPYPITLEKEHAVEVLALGGELKNTFCFLRGRHAFVGQHIGDMDNRETLEHYEEALATLQRLFSLNPQVIAHDLHPDYMTTGLAVDYPLPREGIQHHHAHIVSCMADNGIEGRVIGVAWDGTGYGTDNTVWGGEFLVCDQVDYTRWARLSPYPMPGGEACITHLNRMALGVLWEVFADEREALGLYEKLFEVEEREMEALAGQLRSGFNTPLTSGAGRIFDAAAALVGLRKTAYYEGQAACELEAASTTTNRSYPYRLDTGAELWEIDTRPLFQALVSHISAGKSIGEMAGRFHLTLAKALIETCTKISSETGLKSVALSGGVFQNQRLTVMVAGALEKMGFSCYVHRRVPCNDGGISLGQAVVAARRFAEAGGETAAKESNDLMMRGRGS